MLPAAHVGLTRRRFLGTCAVAAAGTAVGAPPTRTAGRFRIIGFIKPFQKLPFTEIAAIAREVGWEGVECPVRKGGAVEPERVADELPRLVDALRKQGLECSVISTDVEDASDPLAKKVLGTASALGIPRYRLKHYYYDLQKPVPPQVETFAGRLKELAQLNAELKIQGSMQNHSGRNYVGAAVWDLWGMIRHLNPEHLGVFFDIGHATIEGGYSWPTQSRLMEPHLSVVSVKDFTWAKGERGWRAEWCPLGQGMVSRQFFTSLRNTRFAGPITQQFEYPLGTRSEMVAAMKKDLAVLRGWLA